ncbi:dehydrogenase [Desmospora sp. 8437]|uniref:Predicted dehydrogenase n=2 Tax=Kroppenstedtia eburnea TaxID=714067 RepID=A0A1N7Q8G8_9BACL|nr:dehydrogenase [Desmospora sp. 8437]SIT19143.1 Predicted dehydrogenase [Kroppenstedtia eburnea]
MSHHLGTADLLLVGTGRMAKAYAEVLKAFCLPFDVVGRSESSVGSFMKETGVPARSGGVEEVVGRRPRLPGFAIVAVDVEQLAPATLFLLRMGVKNLLVEKPGGLNGEEIAEVAREAKEQQANVYIAYNRRFYASVRKARQMIERDGGVCSFTFDFSERSDLVAVSSHSPEVKKAWFLANSSHVVDLAFYLGGEPKEICCYTAGGLIWHPTASVFSGAGVTEEGGLFSYHANWEAPGRWGIEMMTKQHRLILRPLEALYAQKPGAFNIEEIKLDDELDHLFKPGLFRQVRAFLKGECTELVTIEQHAKRTANLFSLIGKA